MTSSSRALVAMGISAHLMVSAGCPPRRPAETSGPDRGDRSREDRPVAVVNGEAVTVGEFETTVESLPAYVRAEYRTVERRRELLESAARFEVLADLAERRTSGRVPRATWAMKERLADAFVRGTVGERVSMDSISDRAVERAYREQSDRYRRPARRRVAVIQTNSRQRAAYLKRRLEERGGREPAQRVEAFRKMASRRSVDGPTAQRGGDLGWIAAPDGEDDWPDVARAVFELEEKGRISRVFRPAAEDRPRWAIATYYRAESGGRSSLDEVARDVRTSLYQRRRAEERRDVLDRWRRQTAVEVDDELAERLDRPDGRGSTRVEEIRLVPTESEPARSSGEASAE